LRKEELQLTHFCFHACSKEKFFCLWIALMLLMISNSEANLQIFDE